MKIKTSLYVQRFAGSSNSRKYDHIPFQWKAAQAAQDRRKLNQLSKELGVLIKAVASDLLIKKPYLRMLYGNSNDLLPEKDPAEK